MSTHDMPVMPAAPINLLSAGEALTVKPFNPRADSLKRFRRNKAAMIGSVWALFVAVVAVATVVPGVGPWIQRVDPTKIDLTLRPDGKLGCTLEGPTKAHWLGCDLLGRDLWSRILNGARISMVIALATIAISLILALSLGAISGFSGGWKDSIIMRVADIFVAIPYFAVVLAFTSTFGNSIVPLAAAIVTISWMGSARLFRASVLQTKNLDYIEAARASGLSTGQILRRHVAPNAIQPIIASLGASIGGAILSESVFSFLGIGLLPPTPSWGVMVGEARDYITTNPHLFFVPAGALLITTLAFTFMGDGLRDALDPKMRGIK
jgi:peptide/nickel transport system permease protein